MWGSKPSDDSAGSPGAAKSAKSLQLCPTLCDPIPGILQARTLEWVAISFSNAWRWKEKVKSLRHVWLLATPWTAAYQAPPSRGFSRQEDWSGVPLQVSLSLRSAALVRVRTTHTHTHTHTHTQFCIKNSTIHLRWTVSILKCYFKNCDHQWFTAISYSVRYDTVNFE